MENFNHALTYLVYKNTHMAGSPLLSVIAAMLYVADWKSALEVGDTVSGLDWVLTPSGPDLDYFKTELLENCPNAKFGNDVNGYLTLNLSGWRNYFLGLPETPPGLIKGKKFLDFSINIFYSGTTDDYMRFLFSTFPVVVSKPGAPINLVKAAEAYKSVRQNL